MPTHALGDVPAQRVRIANDAPPRRDGDHVLYWMISARRTRFNFALERALGHALQLGKPLVVLEALRCGYRWASDRLHAFVIDGMADNREAFEAAPVLYHPYLEPEPGAGRGLLQALSARACVVVTDEFPCFFLPRMVAAAAKQVTCRLEVVDGNGLLPLRAAPKAFDTAHSLRRFLHKSLPPHLAATPTPDPLAGLELPRLDGLAPSITRRWSRATDAQLERPAAELARLPIDHAVAPVEGVRGGQEAAEEVLERFLTRRLARYQDDRNDLDDEASSGLSPYLHFGHVSAHDVFARVAKRERWSGATGKPTGSKEGWWGMSPPAEAFLDELVTWREVGYVFCDQRPDDYDRYESLPAFARKTLEKHEGDARAPLYGLEELEAATTYDPLWNAAQTQLAREGRIHNYLRMVWGKKVLEWSESPRKALEHLIHLNNKYGLDGRNPNSYSGIFWCLGRFDRAWGPERPIFGTVRYMSSENTARKLRTKEYVRRHRPAKG